MCSSQPTSRGERGSSGMAGGREQDQGECGTGFRCCYSGEGGGSQKGRSTEDDGGMELLHLVPT